MLILTIRTDNPEAELALYNDEQLLAEKKWQAHRALAETLHVQIRDLLAGQKKDWADINGIVCYEGPGSFTGLRIGLSVANALAYAEKVPVLASGGDDWVQTGLKRLLNGEKSQIALPKYGGEANITKPRK